MQVVTVEQLDPVLSFLWSHAQFFKYCYFTEFTMATGDLAANFQATYKYLIYGYHI